MNELKYKKECYGKHIHEHDCKNYHYGDQLVIRECYVNDVKQLKELVLKNALTTWHPAYIAFTDAWNNLTDAEMEIVGNIYYLGSSSGFKELNKIHK